MDYALIDADNHYYEAADCFTRHGDDEVKRFVRWVAEGKRQHLLFGDVRQAMVPNPTFNPVVKPGVLHKRLKALADGDERDRSGPFDTWRQEGTLEQLPRHYQDRDARLAVMDEQGLEKAWMFPTLAVGIEGLNAHDVRMTYKLFHAFNRWLEEDWGWAYQDRLIGAAAIPVLDPVLATEELESVLARGARMVVLRPGPANGRSPADPVWDPFWARVQDADVPVTYHIHAGADAYDEAFRMLWQRHGVGDQVYESNLRGALFAGDRAILDTVAALVLGNLFGRFPRLRIATIELGAAWVPYCLHMLDHSGISITERYIQAFGETVRERPSEVFRRHFWVSPFPEEDIAALVDLIGVDRVLFGSDWPHAEGTEQPMDYAEYLEHMKPDDVRRILRDNALEVMGSTAG